MSYTIELSPNDQIVIKEALIATIEYKELNLTRQRFKLFEYWAMRAANQILSNKFLINDLDKNTFVWLKDQIRHSGELAQTNIGREAIDICTAAIGSRQQYTTYTQIKLNTKLFKEP
jgi:hypothetical protein